MKNKYYTPQIEEFKVGFEYEVFQKGRPPQDGWMYMDAPNTEGEWFKFSWPDPYVGYDLKRLFDSSDDIRVKSLDKQDIEDCGFIVDNRTIDGDIIWSTKTIHDKEYIELALDPLDDNRVTISRYYQSKLASSEDYSSNTIFIGYVKNKSQLQDLLSMLNIK